ncbi:MAG: outer membrane beta-barrel protein [Candidatus Paracaedimonas acanthamoebae]|uniref:Outer membrane beta-barrel protein n=1 Tax=Candidatus Paracaedimonas acanthamoebae TaxID=244581 RepID=A0A8J7Q1Q2_9PROT|nr:outer membrane beta-barrel protein [Candidatus Paracaedimonas acanthamoebae]
MKKLALMLASAAALTSVANAAVEGKNFTGFYVGGQLGYGSGKVKQTASSDLGTSGVVGGLHVGFGKEFNNRLFLGLEAFGNLSNTEGKLNASGDKYRRRNEFGAAIVPGFVCGNALLYVTAGISSATWKTTGHSKRVTGFVPGLGVAFKTSDRVTVGVQGTQALYKKHAGLKARTTDVTGRISYTF